jgi:ubiquitin C-terminal hydrolase
MWRELTELFKVMAQGNYRLSPKAAYGAFAFAKKKFDHDQEDAHEALIFMLGHIHEALKTRAKYNDLTVHDHPKDRQLVQSSLKQLNAITSVSPINQCFMIQFHQRTQCTGCMTISHRFPISYELLLPLNNTDKYMNIYDLLNDFCSRETMEGEEAYHCEKCCQKCQLKGPTTRARAEANANLKCTKTKALKKTTLWRLPECLIVVIGRFKCYWDSRINNMREEKNDKFIDYPVVDFDLTSKTSYPGASKQLYDLYATINHIGRSTHGGHYYACAKGTNRWLILNDEMFEYINRLDQVISDRAYILFYRRKPS